MSKGILESNEDVLRQKRILFSLSLEYLVETRDRVDCLTHCDLPLASMPIKHFCCAFSSLLLFVRISLKTSLSVVDKRDLKPKLSHSLCRIGFIQIEENKKRTDVEEIAGC